MDIAKVFCKSTFVGNYEFFETSLNECEHTSAFLDLDLKTYIFLSALSWGMNNLLSEGCIIFK